MPKPAHYNYDVWFMYINKYAMSAPCVLAEGSHWLGYECSMCVS